MDTNAHLPHTQSASSSVNSLNAYLEIQNGLTDFPCRPIETKRFLIGAGSNCQLQLGGDDLPMVHTVVYQETNAENAKTLHFEVLVSQPELLLNGVPTRTAQLVEGDHLQIGVFQFVMRNIDALKPKSSTPQTVPQPAPEELHLQSKTLESLSALELVNMIENEQNMIEEFETEFEAERIAGADALIDAVMNFLPSEQELPKQELSDDELVKKELLELALQLETQAKLLQEREEQCEAGMESLVRSQEQLSSQLESTLVHIDRIKQLTVSEGVVENVAECLSENQLVENQGERRSA